MVAIAVICGGAVGVWEQRAEAAELVHAAGLEVVSVAVNDAGTEHPDPLHHWASLHPEKFRAWEAARAERGLGGGYRKWSECRRRQHETNVARRWREGSSGLTAIDVALNHAGCVGAILCGVPMDASVNLYRNRPWGPYRRYRAGFQKAAREFRPRVRSMAGWTREQLGFPDAAWFAYLAANAARDPARAP